MMRFHKIIVVIIITSIAAVIVIGVKKSDKLQNSKFFDFPIGIGDWKGENIPMGDYVYSSIETPYLFLRNYYSPRYSVPVNLSIVWFDDTNIAFHAPAECLGGVGNKVKETTTIKVKMEKNEYEIGKLIVGLDGEQKQLVLYYFDVDGYITTNQTDIRLKVLSKRLGFKRTSASFIRLMAPITIDEYATFSMLKTFLEQIFPLLPNYTYTSRVITVTKGV
jgi:EpsI family protein